MLTDPQRRFLEAHRVARLATADGGGRPHVVPICYALTGDTVYFTIDEKPKKRSGASLKRLANVRQNPFAALVVDRRAGLALRDVLFLGALLGYLGWVALSILWSTSVTSSVLEVQRTLVYVLAAVALLLLVRRAAVPSILGGLLAGVTVTCGWGLATRLLPERLGVVDDFAGIRLFEPVGYWNTVGLLAASAVPLALRLRSRVLSVLLVYGAVVAILLTQSRGGLLLAILAAGAWLVFERARYEPAYRLAVSVPGRSPLHPARTSTGREAVTGRTARDIGPPCGSNDFVRYGVVLQQGGARRIQPAAWAPRRQQRGRGAVLRALDDPRTAPYVCKAPVIDS